MRTRDADSSRPRTPPPPEELILAARAQQASTDPEPAAVRRTVVERACELAGGDGAVLGLAEGWHAVYDAACGTLAGLAGMRLSAGTSICGLRPTTGTVLYCRDGETDGRADRAACRQLGVRSIVVVPLSHGGREVGVLQVVSARPNAFDARSVEGLRLMAELLGALLARTGEQRRLLADRAAAVTDLRLANEQLRESEGRFRGAFDAAAIGMALVGLDGRWVKVNASLCQIVGYPEAELLATTFQALTHPDDLSADLDLLRRLVAGEIPSYSLEKRYVHREGRVVWALLTVSVARAADDRPLYFVSQVQDVSEANRREAFEADQRAVLERVAQDSPLDESLARLAGMVERQVDGAWASVLLLQDGDISQVAAGVPPALLDACRPHVYTLAAGLARLLADGGSAVAVSDVAADACWAGPRDRLTALGVKTCWVAAVRAADGEPLGLLAVHCRHDRLPSGADRAMLATAAGLAAIAAEHHQTTRRLARLVRHDPLTGLPNRVCLEDRLGQALAAARRAGRKVGVVVLDVDHFKAVNDTLGHEAGDALLQQFGRRLLGQLRETDTLARTGGDEFTIVLPDLAGPEAAIAVAEKLVGCLLEPFEVRGRALVVTSSMGVALYPDDGDESATLQRRADEQMYVTKRRGRNGFTVAARPAA
jgi:diguanylate cyclase (GGDEF)-like protein/PAS domain S-box-containing protein